MIRRGFYLTALLAALFVALFVARVGWAQSGPAAGDASAPAPAVIVRAPDVLIDDEVPHPPPRSHFHPAPSGAAGHALFGGPSVSSVASGASASQPASGPASQAASQPGAVDQPKELSRKGELSMLGMVELMNDANFAGVAIGYFNIDSVHYVSAMPMVDLHLFDNRLHLDFGATLNFTLFDPNGGGFAAAGKIRRQDWDEWRDYFKIIRRVQFGRKEDHFYVRLSQVGAATIGHGGFMSRYNNNLNANNTHVGLELDAYNDYGGGEAFISDITFQSQVMGGLAFIKPLSFFMQNPIARSLSFGAYYNGDLNAPASLSRDAQGVVITDKADNPRFVATRVHGVGADVEVKPVHLGEYVDIKTYADFNQLIGYGNGWTLGALGRFNFGIPLMAVRARLEYRNLGPQYIPSYFDTFYEVQKLQVVTSNPSTFAPTKLDYLKSLRSPYRRSNMYLEATFAVVDKFALTLAYETGGSEIGQHFLAHAEFTAFDWLRFFATFHKRNFENFVNVFKIEQNTLLFGQVRLEILPILFLNGRVMKAFVWDPSVDFGLGGLRNVLEYRIYAELGWQW